MLTENDVIAAVAKFLVRNGYTITATCTTSQRGIDIEATHPKRGRLLVEAKGETSSKAGTNRHGRPFERKQVRHHVARALYTAAVLAQANPGAWVAIALPSTPVHREMVRNVSAALRRLRITVYLVSGAGRVRVYDAGR
jgi:hypothetical protein